MLTANRGPASKTTTGPLKVSRPASNVVTPSEATKPTGAVDHWSAILFYSMGFGAIAVTVLSLTLLVAVFLYGQFVWTFTHWDMADFRLAPYKRLAYLIVGGTFAAGTAAGMWFLSGAAWRKPTASRKNSQPTRRR